MRGKEKKMKTATLEGLKRYVEDHIPPSGFLQEVLENNLKGAFQRADWENKTDMEEIVRYVVNEMPAICQGSPKKVRLWLKERKIDKRGIK